MSNGASLLNQRLELAVDNGREIELGIKAQEAIGQALKENYDDLLTTPVPDRFLALLAELEASERVYGQ